MTCDSHQAARQRARALLAGPRRRQHQRAAHLAALRAHLVTIQTRKAAATQTVAVLVDLGMSLAEIADLTGIPGNQINCWAGSAASQSAEAEKDV